MVSALLDILLPPRCGGCGALGACFCARCLARTRRLAEPLCPRCGTELPFAGAYCGCRRVLRSLGRLRSAGSYEGPLERAIHHLKYGGKRPLAKALAGLVCERLALDGSWGAALVAVPLHPRRLAARGFNQSDLIAGEVRRRLRLPPAPGTLVRSRDTPPQVGLDRLHRMANVSGAFTWSGPPLAGMPVIVLDDVITTGATLEASAAALREAGSGAVAGLTVARVVL